MTAVRTTGAHTESQQKGVNPGDSVGFSVSLAPNSQYLVVGLPGVYAFDGKNAGRAQVFQFDKGMRSGKTSWVMLQETMQVML